MKIWNRIFKYIKKYWNRLLLAEICMFSLYIVSVVLPYILQKLVDEGIYWKDIDIITNCCFMYLICFCIYVLCQSIYSYNWQRLSNAFSIEIKNDVMNHILKAKTEKRCNMDTGDLMHRIDWETDQFIHIIIKNGFHFINSIFLIVSILVVIGRLNITLAFLLFAAALLPICISVSYKKKGQCIYEKARKEKSILITKVTDSIKNFLTIRISKCEKWRKDIIEKHTSLYRNYECENNWFDFTIEKVIYAVNLIFSILIYSFCVWLIYKNELTLGVFLACIEYIALMHKKMNWMLRLYLDLNKRLISIKRVGEILDEESESSGKVQVKCIEEIAFEDVCFAYDKIDIFKGVNFVIKKGESMALCGKSGAGKSTLLLLLQGFFEEIRGKILINGKPIEELKKHELRKEIGLVLQEKNDFRGSVQSFMQLNGEIYLKEQILDVLKKVGLLEKVCHWENNINESFDNLSAQFSGGEYQRLQIARMLLKDPKVYLLDETTAGLDKETEMIVLKEIFLKRQEKIIILVTHRKVQKDMFDYIYELNEGRMAKCK